MATRTQFVLVDAFTTNQAFSGNPAGVLLLKGFPDPAWMQGVANELQQAETVFLAPGDQGEFLLRWFTPVAEVALCGHAHTRQRPLAVGDRRPRPKQDRYLRHPQWTPHRSPVDRHAICTRRRHWRCRCGGAHPVRAGGLIGAMTPPTKRFIMRLSGVAQREAAAPLPLLGAARLRCGSACHRTPHLGKDLDGQGSAQRVHGDVSLPWPVAKVIHSSSPRT